VVIDFDKPSAKAAPFVLAPPAGKDGATRRAMRALDNAAPADPIAALGLDALAGGPRRRRRRWPRRSRRR
jgi:hypothetical protein